MPQLTLDELLQALGALRLAPGAGALRCVVLARDQRLWTCAPLTAVWPTAAGLVLAGAVTDADAPEAQGRMSPP